MNNLSKYLSYLLRHHPEDLNLDMHTDGTVAISELVDKIDELTIDKLNTIVASDNKNRYEIVGDRIRARQGHSISWVDVGLKPQTPPSTLYHGTATRFKDAILREGLKPMNRNYIHLSSDIETATQVGSRHGKLVIFALDTEHMLKDGYTFYLSTNGVWLVDKVIGSQYLKELKNEN